MPHPLFIPRVIFVEASHPFVRLREKTTSVQQRQKVAPNIPVGGELLMHRNRCGIKLDGGSQFVAGDRSYPVRNGFFESNNPARNVPPLVEPIVPPYQQGLILIVPN
jgi:hypothetical protein